MSQLAARFPVLPWPLLKKGYLYVHLLILLISAHLLRDSLVLASVALLLRYSATASIRHYQQLTSAPDDLCWTGHHFIMHRDGKAVVLSVSDSMFLTGQLMILTFSDETRNYTWCFRRRALGDRGYSALAIAVKSALKTQNQYISENTPFR